MAAFDNFYRDKTVLVTGASGFKGAWLSYWLEQLGARVVGLSLEAVSEPLLFDDLKLSQKQKHHFFDVCETQQIKVLLESSRPDVIFHLAAQSLVLESYRDPLKTFSHNVQGTASLLEAMRSVPAKRTAVIVTSDKCYENQKQKNAYVESDRLGGFDPYSTSKACAELVFASYFKSFFVGTSQKLISVRAGNVIGGGDWAKDRIVPDCVRSWTKGQVVRLRNPAAVRPWQHVLESVSGYLHLAWQLSVNDSLNGESFNVGPRPNAHTLSVRELVEFLAQHIDPRYAQLVEVEPNGTQNQVETAYLSLDCSKVFELTGWQSTLEVADVLADTASWYKAYAKGEMSWQLCERSLDLYCRKAKEGRAAWL